MKSMADELRDLAWKPETAQEVYDEAAAQGRRPARPGESFRLVIHRDPSSGEGPKGGFVPGLSINDIGRTNRYAYTKFKKELYELFASEAIVQGCPAFRNGRPYIRDFYYVKEHRGRDHRNFGKVAIDGLTRAGIIVDDNDEAILLDRAEIIAGDPRPRIEILLLDTRLMTPDHVADLFRASALEQCQRLLANQGA